MYKLIVLFWKSNVKSNIIIKFKTDSSNTKKCSIIYVIGDFTLILLKNHKQ